MTEEVIRHRKQPLSIQILCYGRLVIDAKVFLLSGGPHGTARHYPVTVRSESHHFLRDPCQLHGPESLRHELVRQVKLM